MKRWPGLWPLTDNMKVDASGASWKYLVALLLSGAASFTTFLVDKQYALREEIRLTFLGAIHDGGSMRQGCYSAPISERGERISVIINLRSTG